MQNIFEEIKWGYYENRRTNRNSDRWYRGIAKNNSLGGVPLIRIGHNPNTNMLPMFYHLPRKHPLLEWVTAEPTGHNALLADGQIDTAPISAFSYGQHWREYFVLPRLSVSTKGRVGSILLFSKFTIEELKGKRIALTSQSATSVNLLKVLLHRYYEVFPQYVTMDTGLEEMLSESDAGLLIADKAIRAAAEHPELYIYDLGQEWFNHTGCSMTYSVWAFPKRLLLEKGDELREVHQLLLESKKQSLEDIENVVETCVHMLGLTKEFWFDYFAQFKYELGPGLQEGLNRYFSLCFEEGLLLEKPILEFWPET
jgi:chorismate dehydratase